MSKGNSPMVNASQIAGRLTLRHLRLVSAVNLEGSLVRAAARLNMSQSAVTKALQEVEALLDVTLFERTNRGTIPTHSGAALAANARMILAQVNRASHELTDLRDGNSGHVSIGTLLAASVSLLPTTIARLRRDRPKLTFRVVEATDDVLMAALRSGELDLVIGRLPEFPDTAWLKQEHLIADFACIVTRPDHPLLLRERVGLADTVPFGWVMPHEQTILRRQIDRAFVEAGLVAPVPVIDAVSLLTTRSLLHDTDLVGVWPVQLARIEERAGNVAVVPIELATTRRSVGFTLRRDDRPTPAAEHFIECLRQTARDPEISLV